MRRRIFRKVLRNLCVASLATIAVVILRVAFSQPELTQTQLFLRYWWLHVSGMLFAALVGWFSSKRM